MLHNMKLSTELIAEMSKNIRKGMTIDDCVYYLNIGRTVFYNWQKQGKQLKKAIENKQRERESLTEYEQLCLNFLNELKKAQVKNKMRCVEIIQKEAKNTWQAAAWLLERKYWEEYGKKDYLNIKAKTKVKQAKLLDEDKQRLENEYKAILRGLKKEIFEDDKT